MISDHFMIHTSLNIKKVNPCTGKLSKRKISAITDESLCKEFNSNNTPDTDALDSLVKGLGLELKRTLDVLAPPKEIPLLIHKQQPWYDETVKTQHKVGRNREMVWSKYKTESTWKAYTKERNTYNHLLIFKKDTKSLYKLTCNLTGSTTANLVPPGKTDDELASEFADYFLDKMEKISEMFEGKPTSISEQSDVPRLRRFSSMTQSEVKTSIIPN